MADKYEEQKMIKLSNLLIFGLIGLFSTAAYAQNEVMVNQGKEVFDHNCRPCHGSGLGDDGAPMLPGTHALHLKYRGELPALLEERVDLSAATLRGFIRNGVASMPPFRKTEVTDNDIDALAAFFTSKPHD